MSDKPDQASDDMPDYEVGYKRPPEHTRFKPGVSGNPNGRPKKPKPFAQIVNELLRRRLKVGKDGKPIETAEALVLAQIKAGLEGSTHSMKILVGLAEKTGAETISTNSKADQKLLDDLVERRIRDREAEQK